VENGDVKKHKCSNCSPIQLENRKKRHREKKQKTL